MTVTGARREAALRALDPLSTTTARDQEQDRSLLLALATGHPREEPAAPAARPTRRRAHRVAAITVALGLAGLAGGGVAVARTGAWDDIDGGHRAADPTLVARGTGTNRNGNTPLTLWLAPTTDGGECAAVRATGFALDSCRDGQEPAALTPLPELGGSAGYRLHPTTDADYVYGRVDPGQVSTVRLEAPDRAPVTVGVDRTTGYWVTALRAPHAATLTLTALDDAGTPLVSLPITP